LPQKNNIFIFYEGPKYLTIQFWKAWPLDPCMIDAYASTSVM